MIFEDFEALVEAGDFEFHFEAYFVVSIGFHAVFFGLSILGHHDDGGLEGSEEGEGEVEEDEGVGVEGVIGDELAIDEDPDCEDDDGRDDKGPGTADFGDGVGYSLAEGEGVVVDGVGVFGDTFAVGDVFDDLLISFGELIEVGVEEILCEFVEFFVERVRDMVFVFMERLFWGSVVVHRK